MHSSGPGRASGSQGRGAEDMKGGLTAMIHAVARHHSEAE